MPTSGTNWTSVAIKLLRERAKASQICGAGRGIKALNPLVDDVRFWVSGVALSSVGGAGLIGNILSFITIVTMKKRNLFNNLLLTLTIFDTIFLVNGGAFFVHDAFKIKNGVYNMLFPKVIYPLAGYSMTGEN
jgi:hypothetical protein